MKAAVTLVFVCFTISGGLTEKVKQDLSVQANNNNNNNNNNKNNNIGINGKEYHIFPSETTTWWNAKQRCQQYGWELATVQSQAENFYLLGQLVYNGMINTCCFWIDGPYGYTYWYPGGTWYNSALTANNN